MTEQEKFELAQRLEREIGPMVEPDGDYDCCGCSTYREILEHAKRIVTS